MNRSIVAVSSLVLTVMGSLVIACGDASGPEGGALLPGLKDDVVPPKEAPPPEKSAEPPPPASPVPPTLPASCADSAKTYDPERPVTNVLFVLDRSGSMHLRIPGGQTRWTATRDALFATLDKLSATKTRASVMQFPQGDEPLDCCSITGSNQVDCSACSSFPSPANRCTASKYSPSIPADLDRQRVATIKAQVSASDNEFYWGTPLAAGLTAAINAQKSSTNDGIKAVVLLTDGAPTSCESASNAGANADTYVVDAAKLGLQGTDKVRTFVLGVMDGAAGAPAGLLSDVAIAGGTARFAGCSADDSCFYPVSATTLTANLTSALDRIAREATDCTFAVPANAASDLAKVNVTLTRTGGPQLLSRDATHRQGWDFLTGNKELKLYGEACRVLKEEDTSKVQVVVGCKTTLL